MEGKYNVPKGMRYAYLKERRKFYEGEFDLKRVEQWFEDWPKDVDKDFAVIIGRHTKIFPKKYEKYASTTLVIDEYAHLEDLRTQIIEFLPEAVYYDRNAYDKGHTIIGQELAFDLDPENLTCPIHGTLEDKMKRHQGLAFCEIELNMVRDEAIKLYEELEKLFSNMRVVYSGRGFHIHIFDREPFNWNHQKRKTLAKALKRKGYLIDEWVTTGGMRLIRLPYSLHGMVSRIVLPVKADELKAFDPVNDPRCVPKFISN